jgi:hypothetical protein
MAQVFATPELKAAVELIEANGGKVQFPKQPVVIWGQSFGSIKEMTRDPRCEVCYLTVYKRLRAGMPLEEAVLKANSGAAKPVVCWGETFPSVTALSKDSRCKVVYQTVVNKLKRGFTPEEAVVDLPHARTTLLDESKQE